MRVAMAQALLGRRSGGELPPPWPEDRAKHPVDSHPTVHPHTEA